MTMHVFIDASNLWEAQKAKGKFFDFNKLISYLKAKHGATSARVFYYTAYPADGTRSYSIDGKHKFYTFLEKGLGFCVRKKELKRILVDAVTGKIEEKGNMDVEMTIDAMDSIAIFDIAVLFSGDSDFLALVNRIKKEGKKAYIYSSRNNASEELKTGGDGYWDVLKITDDIWGRDLKPRPSIFNQP